MNDILHSTARIRHLMRKVRHDIATAVEDECAQIEAIVAEEGAEKRVDFDRIDAQLRMPLADVAEAV